MCPRTGDEVMMSMAATPGWSISGEVTAGMPAGALPTDVLRDFATAEQIWRGLAATGHATPYQDFDFCRAYVQHVDAPTGGTAALVVLRSPEGVPLGLVPLVIHRKGPFGVASFIGGKHANFNMPLFARGAERCAPELYRAALIAAGRSAGIDVFCLHAQPIQWEGFDNPFAAFSNFASPSQGYKLALAADADALLKRRLSKDTRRKTRQKEQRLAGMGELSYRRPETADERRAVLERFLALKAERFARQGIADPFSGADVRAFLAAGLMPADGSAPFIELHTLDLSGRAIAIFGAVVAGGRFSGLFTAFDSDPEIARSSPGDILLMHMIRHCCERGLATFDLGVGEAHYKDKICDATEPLVETFIPVTLAGQVIALACIGKQRAKAAIKQSSLGKRGVDFLRSLRAKG
jgi:CelD/BcsL family acetyltransferase involved in cellulose biosynthesis